MAPFYGVQDARRRIIGPVRTLSSFAEGTISHRIPAAMYTLNIKNVTAMKICHVYSSLPPSALMQ